MATDKMIWLNSWTEDIMNDNYIDTTAEEMAYILYAAEHYCRTGEKIDIGEKFGKEYKGLNRTVSSYYRQIDNILHYNSDFGKKYQKYDNERIESLAAEGKTQKEICEELGYDLAKSRSLSSNAGYKNGRARFLAKKDCANMSSDEKMPYDF